jgi:hypothetical protein
MRFRIYSLFVEAKGNVNDLEKRRNPLVEKYCEVKTISGVHEIGEAYHGVNVNGGDGEKEMKNMKRKKCVKQ